MSSIRIGTANLDKELPGDAVQLRHLRSILATGLLCLQEVGHGPDSTRIEAHGVTARNLPQWMVGDVGAHNGVCRRWVKLDGGWVRVFSVHALHVKTSGRVAQDAYFDTLAAGIRRRREPWVVAGDFNRHHAVVARQLGASSWQGDGIIGILASPGLRVTDPYLDSWAMNHWPRYTDHPALFATIRRKP